MIDESEWSERLEALVRGTLDPAEAAVVEAVLAADPARGAERDALVALLAALERGRPEAPGFDPDAMAARVARALSAPHAGRAPGARRLHAGAPRSWRTPVLVAAALLLVAGMLLVLDRRPPPQREVAVEPAPSLPVPVTEAPVVVTPTGPPTAEPPRPTPATETPDDAEAPTDMEPDPSEPAPTPAPEPTPPDVPPPPPTTTTRPPAREVLIARLGRVRGEAWVQRGGVGAWTRVTSGEALAPGDLVAARRGPLEVVLAGPADRQVAAPSLTRVALEPDAALLIAPAEVDLELERGSCHAFLARPLALAVGGRVLACAVGDVGVTLRARGRLEVALHAGAVQVDGREYASPALLTSDRGRELVRRRLADELPRWLVPLLSTGASGVRWLEDFSSTRAYELFEGAREGALVRAVRTGDVARVHLGNSTPRGGLFKHEPGAALWIRYRVARPARVRVQLTDLTLRDNVRCEVDATRPGLWTDLTIDPARCEDAARVGARVQPGDLIGYVTLEAPPEAQLEVSALWVATPD